MQDIRYKQSDHEMVTILLLKTDKKYRTAGKFRGANFRGMARDALKRIFAFQCQETTPTTSFACEIPVRRASLNFRADCSALEKRENFPLYS